MELQSYRVLSSLVKKDLAVKNWTSDPSNDQQDETLESNCQYNEHVDDEVESHHSNHLPPSLELCVFIDNKVCEGHHLQSYNTNGYFIEHLQSVLKPHDEWFNLPNINEHEEVTVHQALNLEKGHIFHIEC